LIENSLDDNLGVNYVNKLGVRMKNYQVQTGFSLIELMIALGIVAVLTFIAYPSYTSAVKKSNRTDAKVGLTDVAQQLQRCYTAYSKFNDAANCTVYKQLTTDAKKITTGGAGYYDITLNAAPAVTATTYTLTAKAVKTPQTKDNDCAEFSINQAGQKTAKTYAGVSTDTCW
jgi:type IV pilus assembly protein PilE